MSSGATRPGYHSSGTPPSDSFPWFLKKDHAWSEDLAHKSRDLLCLHDLEGRLISVNAAAAHLLGYSVEELLRIPMRELVSPEFRWQFDEYLKTIARAGEAHGLLAVVTRSGERRIWEFHNLLRTEGVSARVVRGVAYDVTEQKRVEWQLRESRESEERYRFIAALAEGVILVGADGRVITSNHSAECILGIKPGELAGESSTLKAWEPDTIHEDGSSFPAEEHPAMVTLRTGQPQSNVCMGLRRADGEVRWLLINSQPLCHTGEIKPYAAVVSFTDITKRKQAEEALRASELRFRQAARVSHIGIFDHDHHTDTIYWSPEQREIFGLGPDEVVTLPVCMDRVYPQDREAIAVAVRRAHDPAGDGFFDVEHRIVRRDGNIRWLTMQSQTFFEGEGDARHKVRTVGAVLDITERHQMEEERQKLVEVAQNSPDFIGIATFDGKVLFVNEAGQALVGVERDQQITSTTIFDYLPPDEIARFGREVLPVVYSGKLWWGEVLLKHFRTGELIPVEMRAFPICDAYGEVIAIANVSRDIRESKQREEVLRQAEEKYRGIFDNAILGIFQSTPEGRYLSVNQAMARMYGCTSPQEMVATITDIAHQQYVDPLRHREFMRLLEEQGAVREFVFEIYRKDGSRGWASLNARAVRDRRGELLYYEGTQEDISERKQAEEALQQSEERLRLAQEAAKVGTFEYDFRTGENRWTPEVEAIFGVPPGGFPRSIEGFLDLVHGEDRPYVGRLVEQSMQAGVVEGEWRVVWPDGTVHWIAGRWRVFHDQDGRPLRAIGIDYEITERKRVEEELRLAKERLSEENLYLEQEIDTELGFEEIIGRSVALREVMEKVGKVASSSATVLLLGETGTGKELVARALHRLSKRAGNSFIKMNCAAIPSGLLESELFGHEKGAFTGAVARKIGRLELADKGTLFLDEIGEIPLMIQPKLLRVLQDMEFERLGGTQTLKVDFRLIAATNRDLAEGVRENEFRSDLYYRLNVFPIRIPPLRERRDDIRLLVEHFVQKFSRKMNRAITSIPKATVDVLMEWDWPGNVRELENFIERSVILTHGSVLAAPLSELSQSGLVIVDETLEAAEREHILWALRASHGRISGPNGAAERLGLKRTTLQSKLKQMGIDRRWDVDGN